MLVAISNEEFDEAKAFDVMFDVALVCWNRLLLLVAMSNEELEEGNAADVIAEVALVCWNKLEMLVAMALVVMSDAA